MPSPISNLERAAAHTGLAHNRSLPIGDRLNNALKAINLYEQHIEDQAEKRGTTP